MRSVIILANKFLLGFVLSCASCKNDAWSCHWCSYDNKCVEDPESCNQVSDLNVTNRANVYAGLLDKAVCNVFHILMIDIKILVSLYIYASVEELTYVCIL